HGDRGSRWASTSERVAMANVQLLFKLYDMTKLEFPHGAVCPDCFHLAERADSLEFQAGEVQRALRARVREATAAVEEEDGGGDSDDEEFVMDEEEGGSDGDSYTEDMLQHPDNSLAASSPAHVLRRAKLAVAKQQQQHRTRCPVPLSASAAEALCP
ncbi:MAG: hypothetical protein AAGD35_23755, partial [Actinomycetota bacterium]